MGFPLDYIEEETIKNSNSINDLWQLEGNAIGMYVLNDFSGEVFDKLCLLRSPFVGSVALIQCALREIKHLHLDMHPIHNLHLKDIVIDFCDIKEKQEVARLRRLIRFMCGTTIEYEDEDGDEDLAPEVTHLIVENKDLFESERLERIWRIPIVVKEWIDFVWANRFDCHFNAKDGINNFRRGFAEDSE